MEIPQLSFAACFPMPRSIAGPLVAPGKYAVVLALPGGATLKTELIVLPDARSRLSEAERKAHESAISSAYALQEQLGPARQAAQTLGRQLSAMRAFVPAEVAQRVSQELSKALGDRWGMPRGLASRAQSAIDAYEGAPTAEQSRELEAAWDDALSGVGR